MTGAPGRPRRMPYSLLVESVREVTGYEPGRPGWDIAMVLLSSANVGPSVERVARHTHLPRERVAEIGRACRGQRIWKGSQPDHAFLHEDPGSSAAAFLLDVLAVRGFLLREDRAVESPHAVG